MAKRLINNSVVLAKVGKTPAVTDVVNISSAFTPSFTAKSGNYKQFGGNMGGEKQWVVSDYLSVNGSLECFLRANGGGGAEIPKLSEMFKMCGLDETVTDDEKVTYTPNNSEIGTGQITYYLDGMKRDLNGLSSNLKLGFSVGEPVKATFDIQGFSNRPSSLNNPDVTLDESDLFIVTSISAVSLSGATLQLTKCDFDLGNEIKEVYAIETKEFYRSDFTPKISLTEKAGEDISFWADFLDGNIKKIEIELTSKSGKKFTFKADNLAYTNVNEADGDGVVEITRDFICQAKNGLDNFSMEFK